MVPFMSCEVSALSFQAHAKNGTWSIDFDMLAFSIIFSIHSILEIFPYLLIFTINAQNILGRVRNTVKSTALLKLTRGNNSN